MVVKLITQTNTKPSNSKTVELLYSYNKENLSKVNDLLYRFPETSDTDSVIEYKKEIYKGENIYITPKLHEGSHCGEVVIEHIANGKKPEKLYVVLFLERKTSKSFFTSGDVLTFPLMQSNDLGRFVKSGEKSASYYFSKDKYPVVVFNQMVAVNDTLPDIKGNAKSIYKELFEPNTFDVLSSIITLQDKNAQQTVTTLPIQLSEKWFETNDKTKEGFGSLQGQGTYMECVALDEDTNDEIADYAVVPLKQSGTAKAYSTVVYGFGSVLILVAFTILNYCLRVNGSVKTTLKNSNSFITKYFSKSMQNDTLLGIVLLVLGFILILLGALTVSNEKKVDTGLTYSGILIFLFGIPAFLCAFTNTPDINPNSENNGG
jgi:hypothetical protein